MDELSRLECLFLLSSTYDLGDVAFSVTQLKVFSDPRPPCDLQALGVVAHCTNDSSCTGSFELAYLLFMFANILQVGS